VLLLQRKRETVDDGAQNLQQLRDAVEAFCFVDELEEDVVDGPSDVRPQVKELSVNSVKGGLEEVSFAGVFGIEEFKQLHNVSAHASIAQHGKTGELYLKDEAVVDVLLRDVGVKVGALDEAQEELVHHLDVGPSNLEDRLVFFGVECFALRVYWWRNGSEEILGKHLHDLRVHSLSNDLAVVGDVVKKLVQSQSLDFL
jgi:hypothetical protein